MKTSRSVAITGATGFVGWHVAEAFRDAGWKVTASVRPGSTKRLPEGVDSVEAALLDADALTRAFDRASVIVHAAALTQARNEDAVNAVNVVGTKAVVDAANRLDARIVLLSSQAAIGTGTPRRPSEEDDVPRPLTAYGRSKLASEEAVKSGASAPWIIVRPSAVYGPRDRNFLPLFRLASRGLFLLVADPATAFTFIYVDDVARAVLLAARALDGGAGEPGRSGGAETAGRETLFIGHPRPHTGEDLLRQLADTFKQNYRPRRVPGVLVEALSWIGELTKRMGTPALVDRDRLIELRASGFVCAVDRARERIGFTATVGLSEGVERTARWYREQGWI